MNDTGLVTLTGNCTIFLLNLLDHMDGQKNCFSGKRKFSRLLSRGVRQRGPEDFSEEQGVDSHILEVIKFLSDKRELSGNCCKTIHELTDSKPGS